MFVIRNGSYPSAKHAADLIQLFLKLDVVLLVYYFKRVSETN